mmetsp:Transcript_9378/g.14133  ORF Transcript_9378/g.14133 Transcript_9378/m.14133 type:complete len:241 (+) Transcript_9378:220-942(+)
MLSPNEKLRTFFSLHLLPSIFARFLSLSYFRLPALTLTLRMLFPSYTNEKFGFSLFRQNLPLISISSEDLSTPEIWGKLRLDTSHAFSPPFKVRNKRKLLLPRKVIDRTNSFWTTLFTGERVLPSNTWMLPSSKAAAANFPPAHISRQTFSSFSSNLCVLWERSLKSSTFTSPPFRPKNSFESSSESLRHWTNFGDRSPSGISAALTFPFWRCVILNSFVAEALAYAKYLPLFDIEWHMM